MISNQNLLYLAWSGSMSRGLNASFEVFSHRKIPYIIYDKGIQGQKSICARAKYEAMLSWFPACYRLGTTPLLSIHQTWADMSKVAWYSFSLESNMTCLRFCRKALSASSISRSRSSNKKASLKLLTRMKSDIYNGWKWSECKADWWKFESCRSSGTSGLTLKIS